MDFDIFSVVVMKSPMTELSNDFFIREAHYRENSMHAALGGERGVWNGQWAGGKQILKDFDALRSKLRKWSKQLLRTSK